MKRRLLILFLLTLASCLGADLPLRECTLKAPVNSVSLPSAQLKPYQQNGQAVLKLQGLLFPPGANKNIEAAPTGDNSTPLRTAINYHRSLRNENLNAIASYWHPALQDIKKQQFAQSNVLAETKKVFSQLDHVELLGMLDINNRQVVFIRYHGKTHAYITVETQGNYYLVSDPGIEPQVAIACAAFDQGSATMANP